MNPELSMTLDESISEVLGHLTGLDLQYLPESDRYYSVTRQLNRALRANALEREWSFYASTMDLGPAGRGTDELELPEASRARVIGDDSVRLVDERGRTHRFAYFLPRDAIEKYRGREGLWVAQTRTTLRFSRPLGAAEGELNVLVPVQREPEMFRLPVQPTNPDDETVLVSDEIREQLLDFSYPDVIIARAAFQYAQTDPIMQPRVQTLEALYKDLMYQVIEREDRNTDSPYLNEFRLPISNGPTSRVDVFHWHPHSDERM